MKQKLTERAFGILPFPVLIHHNPRMAPVLLFYIPVIRHIDVRGQGSFFQKSPTAFDNGIYSVFYPFIRQILFKKHRIALPQLIHIVIAQQLDLPLSVCPRRKEGGFRQSQKDGMQIPIVTLFIKMQCRIIIRQTVADFYLRRNPVIQIETHIYPLVIGFLQRLIL